MVPEFHKGGLIYAEHLTRYRSALPVVSGLIALDIACGSGYGTQVLATEAQHVYGVDVSADAVAYARAHFDAPNVEFLVGDAVSIPLPDDSVDVVVTFETIEHIEDHLGFVKEMKRVLKPGGVALVSTPNDLEFAEGNHFHLHEFEYNELMELLTSEFAFTTSLFQATWKFVAVGTEDSFVTEGPIEIPTENLAPLERDKYLYFYVVCSDRPIEREVAPVAALGAHYSDRAQIVHDTTLRGQIAHLEGQVAGLESRVEEMLQRCADLEDERDHARQERDDARDDLAAVWNTKLMRYSRPLREGYARLRLRGPRPKPR
jgi:SAM-dependent methyltransferase